ncbi:MAG: hypothetical protein JHD28_00030 [Bacteroidia bacterium]|nr:hypothetical protein [Bacteroidia bacterium]
MQPIKITIYGDYFDCQIYRGRLYLWTFDGALSVYDWNSLVNSFIKKETDMIAMTFCFMDGNYLYKSSLFELFKDLDFKKLLFKKFESVTKNQLSVSEKNLSKFLIGSQDTPTGLIPTDTEIYSNKLYFINDKGLFSASAHRGINEKYQVSSRPTQLWDCNLLSIKANKYPQLALSGGEEGLFELNISKSKPTNLKRIEQKAPIYQISDKHSSFSNYTFLSIYNTSLVNNSFIALFKWNLGKENLMSFIPSRDFDKTVNDKEIFKTQSNRHYVSWGIEDKLYKATDLGFEIIKFNNYAKPEKGEDVFTRLANVNLHPWKGQVINGSTAYFGNIIECENALIVLQSDKQSLTIPGPITRWRVYPRSMNYENHLHVILEDRIEIYSFNQDYFLNQEDKEIGIQFKAEKHRRTAKTSYFEDFNNDDFPF